MYRINKDQPGMRQKHWGSQKSIRCPTPPARGQSTELLERKTGVTPWRNLGVLELEHILFTPSLSSERRALVVISYKVDPQRRSCEVQGNTWTQGLAERQNPLARPGLPGHRQKTSESFGHRQRASERGQVRRGHKSPPSFPQSQGGFNGKSKLPSGPEVP